MVGLRVMGHLGALVWYPSLLAAAAVLTIGHGADAMLTGTTLAMLVVCLGVWCHTAILILQRVMQRRSLRELVALVGLVVLVVGSMAPAIFQSQGVKLESTRLVLPDGLMTVAGGVARGLPPSIAVGGLEAIIDGNTAGLLPALGWLGLWIAVGVACGYRILAGTLSEGGSESRPGAFAAGDSMRKSPGLFSMDRLAVIPLQARAVAAKELHYLLRSTVGKFNIVIMPLLIALVGLVVGRDLEGPVLGLDPHSLVFCGAMLYASMFSNNFIHNAFAWEGAGVRSYFISPAPLENVVLGKNLGVWLYNGILGLEGLIAFSVVVGLPNLWDGVSGLLVFAVAVVGATVAGNFVSTAFPVARDPSKFTNTPSQIGVAASLGMLAVNAALIGSLVAIPALLGAAWLRPILLAGLLAVRLERGSPE